MTPTPTPDDGDGGDGGGGGGGGGQPGDGYDGEVEIRNATLARDMANTGAPVVVRVDLANFDTADGRITLELAADGSVVAERTVSVGASTRRTVALRARFDEPGEYALDVNGIDAGTVTINGDPSESTPSGTPGPETPPGPPTDAPDGDARPDTRADGPADPVRVDLEASPSNGTASAALDDSLRGENVSLRRLDVSVPANGNDGRSDGSSENHNDDVGFVVTQPSNAVPETARELDAGTAVQYFTLSPTNDSRDGVETVDLQFEVNASALPAGTSPEDVVLYHYTGDEWVALPTTYDASTDTYTATVDGFSPFAVGVSAGSGRGDVSTQGARLTEIAGIPPASPDGSDDARDPATGTAAPAGSSGPAIPWLFWSGLGGFALLFVLFLARNRVPFGGAGSDGPSALGDGSERASGGRSDDD